MSTVLCDKCAHEAGDNAFGSVMRKRGYLCRPCEIELHGEAGRSEVPGPPAGADQEIESTFIVVMRSGGIRPARADEERDNQAVSLLRALHYGAGGTEEGGGCRVYEGGVDYVSTQLIYDSKGDDMGHHDGHDEPFERRPAAARAADGGVAALVESVAPGVAPVDLAALAISATCPACGSDRKIGIYGYIPCPSAWHTTP